MLVHGDVCFKGKEITKSIYTFFYKGIELKNGDIIKLNTNNFCYECFSKTFIFKKKYEGEYSLECSKCHHVSWVYRETKDIKVVKKTKKVFVKYSDIAFAFRCDSVPDIHKYRNSKSQYGRSKKGLVFSSYKRSFDQQLLTEDEGELDFKDKYMENVYHEYGMFSYDLPIRNQPLRSWKRSKKRKQWM